MRSDLDKLMEERKLDALLVVGDASGNKILNYLTGGAHLENVVVAKRRGDPLTLVHGLMEREIAAKTGMNLVNRDEKYNGFQLLQKHNGDAMAARVDWYAQVARDEHLHGRMGVYGTFDAGAAYAILTRLNEEIDGEVVGEFGDTVFTIARETKDDRELAEMAEAGRLTSLTVGDTWEFIASHSVRGETVIKRDGEALTIGDVKRFIRERYMHYGLVEDHGCIFSQGRDAGIPHNSGDPDMPLQLGKSIVFDIFPMVESGYFHDLTRTWSLGYATDEVQKAWDETKVIFDRILDAMEVGKPLRDYQVMTCEYYEALGHKTVLNSPGTQEGYVHSLGHGLGLDIHEEPRLSHAAGNSRIGMPGHVVSVEPGLYYPEQGYGVRIEDTVAFNEAGRLVNFSNVPYDLIIPMKR